MAALLAAAPAPAALAAEGPSVALGAYLPKANERPQRVDAFARLAGRPPVVVSYYKPWDFVPFDPVELERIWRRGAVPMVTWEPLGYEGRDYPLSAIQRGRFDAYVRESARAAATWGKPIRTGASLYSARCSSAKRS